MSRRSLDEAAPAPTVPHVSVVRRPLGPSTKSNVLPTSTTTAPPNAIKSQLKLEDRLSKAETKIHDLQREKITVQNELGDLQTELRLAAQREAKLKHNLEKWEKSHASLKEKSSKLTDLQARLGELHKVHEESKARRQKEIDELTERLKKEEEKRKHDVAEAKHLLTSEKARAQEYQAKHTAVEAELEHLRLQGTASKDVLQEKQGLIEELQSQREAEKTIAIDAQKYARRIETELNQHIEQLKAQIEIKASEAAQSSRQQQAATEAARFLLQSELDHILEEMDEIERQHAHNLAMVVKSVSEHIAAAQQRARTEKDVLVGQWHRSASEKIRLETVADERAAQIRELVAVVKQVQDDRDAAKQVVKTLEADLTSIAKELAAERQLADTLIAQQEELQGRTNISTSASFGDLSGLSTALGSDEAAELLHSQLEDVQSRNTLLQEEADDLQQRFLSRSKEAKAAEEALASARAQVATLETSVAAKTREVDRLISQLSELEPLRRRLASAISDAAEAKKEAAAQAEAARAMTASLQNARIAEKAWREERDRMASLLDHAEQFESLYNELSAQTKLLLERNALAEEEKASLSALNSELLSHNNPMQKIMYMDRVRQELGEVKQENLTLRLQLERLEEANSCLEREVASYKAVDVPLSQRPRAEVTRVMRVGEHEGLMRQVSGEVEYRPKKQVKVAAAEEVSTPVRAGFGMVGCKTPFTAHGPRFTAVPLQPELQKTLQVEKEEKYEEEEIAFAETEMLPHPPLPVDTGLSPKKRRSYGNLSVHAAEESPEAEAEEQEQESEDDTLLPLPVEEPEVAVRKVNRNRPRATLVNSGALRVGPDTSSSTSSIPIPVPVLAPHSDTATPATANVGSRRPSLATSTLGIKARRVSELVRASTPPLPSIADFSNLETPNNHLLLDAALPSPSPYGLADWTATDETSHVPALNTQRLSRLAPIAHSTPLAAGNRMRKSRYSGAQRIPLVHSSAIAAAGDASMTPKIGAKRNNLLAVTETNGTGEREGGLTYEDEHDSFRKGWLYEGEEEMVDLPEFSIEGGQKPSVGGQKKKEKKGLKGRGSMKVVKPGPMARTFFR